jgi:hypothetical protein
VSSNVGGVFEKSNFIFGLSSFSLCQLTAHVQLAVQDSGRTVVHDVEHREV